MRIRFGDLKVSDEAKNHLEEVVRSNFISGGPKVKQLEDTWGKLFGYNQNLAMTSGTAADMAACMVLYDLNCGDDGKTKMGDEIIAPALAFAAVGNSIRSAGFKPVFVDVKRETMNIDVNKIEEKITPKTRAIMVAHTMGKPCGMNRVTEIAEEYNLRVIEDCCEAHGGKYDGKFVGSFGDMATFSFYVAHIVSCGDGGMISTSSQEIRNLLHSVKHHGRKTGSLYFDHLRYGLNFRMNDLTASIGLPDIKNFFRIFDQRKKNLITLTENVKDLTDFAYFVEEDQREIISPHAFSVILKKPEFDYSKLYCFLESKGIECKRNFGSMPTQHKAFDFLGHRYGEFPEAEYVGNNGLHFGIHQHLAEEDISYASDVLHEYFKKI